MNFLFKKVHAGRDLFALLGELNQGPGDRPPKLKKGAGILFDSMAEKSPIDLATLSLALGNEGHH